MKILIIKTGALGDIVIASAIFQTVKKNYPESEIYLLTQEIFREVVEDSPVLAKIFYLPAGRDFSAFSTLIKKLRRIEFDMILDIQGNLKTNFYTSLIGAKKRIGLYGRKAGRIFLSKAVKKRKDLNPFKHQESFLNEVNIKDMEKPVLWISDTKKKQAEEFIFHLGLKQSRYIVIHPAASPEWKTKRWLAARFAELADKLTDKGFTVVFVGKGSKEISVITGLTKKETVNLSDKTDFAKLVTIIKNAVCLITTDSAPIHIGAAAETKTIGIFGPTAPERHCPPGTKYIFKAVSCSPCYKKNCPEMHCMNSITVEDVLSEIELYENSH